MLVSRLNLFWGLNWTTVPEYLNDASDLSNFDIVIGCVDTRGARKLIDKKVCGLRSRVAYYLDLGNSSDSGQFVLGQPLNSRNPRAADRLRVAPELFPELVDERLDAGDGPSCSALEALERQAPFTNPVLAQHALALLAHLFRYGRIDHHGAFVNIATNHAQPIAVNPRLWRKMRRRGQRVA